MPLKKQPTSYAGAVVAEEQARALQKLPEADFLSFRTLPEGGVLLGAKLPEMGQGETGPFRLRENFNWFMRGVARGCFDENGTLTPTQMSDWIDRVDTWINPDSEDDPDFTREFLNVCGIPKKKQADFLRFLSDPDIRLELRFRTGFSQSCFSTEADTLREFQYLTLHRNDPAPEDPEQQTAEMINTVVNDSYGDFRNRLSAYVRMATSDPETETGILFPIDCHDYAKLNQLCLNMTNRWRNENGLPNIRGQHRVLRFEQQQMDPARGIVRAFDAHSVFTLTIPSEGGQTQLISLETTAPPCGKMLFHPDPGRIGTGIWDNGEEIDRYHADRNLIHIPNEALYLRVRHTAKNNRHSVTEFTRDPALEAECDLRAFSTGPERSWHDIRLANRIAAIREERLTRDAAEAIRSKPNADIDSARLSTKQTIAILTAEDGEYTAAAAGDREFAAILPLLREYAALDAAATHGDYRSEQKLFDRITGKLETVFARMSAEQINETSDLPENRTRFLACANLLNLMESERSGRLMPRGDELTVNGTAHPIENTRDLSPNRVLEDVFLNKGRRSAKNGPLFPHEPSPNDISQGNLGDCYLLAGLSSLASRWPEQIKKNMRDNGDGTVTVRFWKKNPPPEDPAQFSERAQYTPVLVTVDKIYNRTAGTEDCLWAQMIERAYTASGLHLSSDPYLSPVPADIDRRYENIVLGQDKALHGKDDLPWLYDNNGNLHKWQPDYTQIEGGQSHRFLEQFLGPDGVGEVMKTADFSKPLDALYRRGEEAQTQLDASGTHGIMLSLLREAVRQKLGNRELPNGALDTLSFPQLIHNFINGAMGGTDTGGERELCVSLQDAFQRAIRHVTEADADWMSHPAQTITQALDELDTCLTGVINGTITKKEIGARLVPDSALGLLQAREDCRSEDNALPKYEQLLPSMLAEMRAHIAAVAPTAAALVAAEPALRAEVADITRRKRQPLRYSGELGLTEQTLLDTLQSALDRGDIVNAGTPGENDRIVANGLRAHHAYSVLGIRREAVQPNGPTLTFIRVRNPWGTSDEKDEGLHYFMKNGIVCTEVGHNTVKEGCFDIEISDFLTHFDQLYINHISPELLAEEKKNASRLDPEAKQRMDDRIGRAELAREARQAEQREALSAPEPEHSFKLTGDTRIRWGNALRELRALTVGTKNSSSEKKDSPQFKNLVACLTDLTDHKLGPLGGKTDRELLSALESVEDSAESYLEYCRKTPKTGSRRETRIRAAVAILELTDAARKGYADPGEYFKDKILNRFYENLRQEQLERNEHPDYKREVNEIFDDPAYRERAVAQMRGTQAFRAMTDGVGIRRLSALLSSPDNALRDFRSRLRKTQQPQNARANAPENVRRSDNPQRHV